MASASGPPIVPPIDDAGLKLLAEQGIKYSDSLYATIPSTEAQKAGPKWLSQASKNNTFRNWDWSDYNTSGSTPLAFNTMFKAIESLRGPGHRELPWPDDYIPSTDTRVYPFGNNIRINCKRDIFQGAYQGHAHNENHGRCEGLYNARDGLIILTHIQPPVQAPGDRRNEAVWKNISDVVWYVWHRLHFQRDTADTPQDWTAAQKRVEERGNQAREFGTVMPQLTSGLTSAQMAVYASKGDYELSISRLKSLKGYLKHIITHHHSNGTISVINRCKASRLVGNVPFWDSRTTFRVGHWAFYALLATDIGEIVTWFLTRHKNDSALGLKMVKSITIFHPQPEGVLTEDDRQRWVLHPALLFEIVNRNDELRQEETTTRKEWDKVDGPDFKNILQPQYGPPPVDRQASMSVNSLLIDN